MVLITDNSSAIWGNLLFCLAKGGSRGEKNSWKPNLAEIKSPRFFFCFVTCNFCRSCLCGLPNWNSSSPAWSSWVINLLWWIRRAGFSVCRRGELWANLQHCWTFSLSPTSPFSHDLRKKKKKKSPLHSSFFFLNHTLWNTVLMLYGVCLMMSIWVCGYRN